MDCCARGSLTVPQSKGFSEKQSMAPANLHCQRTTLLLLSAAAGTCYSTGDAMYNAAGFVTIRWSIAPASEFILWMTHVSNCHGDSE